MIENTFFPEVLTLYPHCMLTEAIITTNSFSETNMPFLKDLILSIKNSKNNNFSNVLEKYNIKIIIVDSSVFLRVEYNNSCVIFYINRVLLNVIKNADNECLQDMYILFVALYSQEDIHIQLLSKYNFLRNYKTNKINDRNNRDLEYSGLIEADAYGKQMGKHLKDLYPEKSMYGLYDIVDNTRDIKYFMDIYKDPAISKDAKKKFYKAFFDEIKS